MKVTFTILLMVSLILSSSLIQTAKAGSIGYCNNKCGLRCAKAGYRNRCIKYCGICCKDCNCVPSGTYGNKHECPCYRNKMNSKGKPKCP